MHKNNIVGYNFDCTINLIKLCKTKCDDNECDKLQQQRQQKSMKPKFKCNYKSCDKQFVHNYHLNRHKRKVHLRQLAFKCEYNGCNKSFSDNSHLTKHRFKHTGERPHICQVKGCRQRYKRKENLTKHLKRDHK
ncbi:zinc finger protein 714-like [Oppia nitens]|uniref:zinc finger protein 714-like n=1 Tax=Oppia nitens TaxID=1686743 RepID=UPI0023DC8992|nr:zinc finger protein 714-like [Oppia nitens]